jgi:hypothetical protein
MISIINDKAGIVYHMICANTNFAPQLQGYMPHGFTPIYIGVLHESIKDIFMSGNKRLKGSFTLRPKNVLYAKAREEQQTLKDCKKLVYVVLFAFYANSTTLSHFNRAEYATDILHCFRHIGFIKECFDIRKKRCNFVY